MKTARRLLALCALVLLPGLAPGVLAHTLSGTVYGNGSPLADAGIVLTLAADGGSAGETTTNASGVYSLEVADGSYNLLVQPSSRPPAPGWRTRGSTGSESMAPM
jgi:hypothetical protein